MPNRISCANYLDNVPHYRLEILCDFDLWILCQYRYVWYRTHAANSTVQYTHHCP
jgi:hypothetical protein